MKIFKLIIAVSLAAIMFAGCSSMQARDSYDSGYSSTSDDSDDDFSKHFSKPLRIKDLLLVSYDKTVESESEEFAAAVLAGLVITYAEASSDDTIGVIITTDDGSCNAYAIEARHMDAFANDRMTSDELIDKISVVSLDE